jgi:alkaline phosphatase D
MLTTRRSLLIAASLAAAPRPAWAQALARGVFTHGVASGDPLPDGIILWTRFVSADGALGWEIAEDETFARVTQRGLARASPASDYCVKVDARGLAPGRRYFYRFLSASGPSPTGITRTAPASGDAPLHIALVSCANYAYGYFHAYADLAARADIDLVLHAGDYIYEMQRGRYPGDAETVAGRAFEPTGECVTLADYYQRYAQYHTEPDLLELRRLKPIAAVWDDHELVNNTWREGAADHHAQYEGLFLDRIASASKAYFDWMPIRRPDARAPRVYRALDWGDLARILLLDTRHIGRDQQIDYRTTLMPQLAQGGADATALTAAFRANVLDDPRRTMLGAAQEDWFSRSLADSKQRGQRWQIVTQQVVMAEQIAPANITRLIPEGAASATRQFYAAGERASALGLPWNLDSWNGYPAARVRFLDACTTHGANVVVLGGDSHNCWLNNLAAASGDRLAALEFAGGSVSSPGFERPLSAAATGEREAMMRRSNQHLAWCDLTHRGYATLRFTRTACEAEWVALDEVRVAQRPTRSVTRLAAEPSTIGGPSAWTLA